MKAHKYRFIFTMKDGSEYERDEVWFREPEEAFDRACALLDFGLARQVRVFEYVAPCYIYRFFTDDAKKN